ncbi:hypothetical protein D3C71_1573080 [compost metagenome]
MMFSLIDINGTSNGIPPASRIPTFTSSASVRRLRLHGLISDQVFRMPTTGRSIRSSRLQPAVDKVERCTKPGRSSLRNQRALRSGRPSFVSLSLMRSPSGPMFGMIDETVFRMPGIRHSDAPPLNEAAR